jgi:hydrogenase nickel incorporation protein HypB
MCESCGCGDATVVSVDVHERLLASNDRIAAHNRDHFKEHGVIAINLMGGPGSGKTALLEATARTLGGGTKIGVLAGDLATDNDAARIRAAGFVAESITTGSACHLDADMVHRGLHRLPWRTFQYLFIENVGNLVCPASYDLGESLRLVVLSVTEGEDKPRKYPTIFDTADVAVITKIDLASAVEFDWDAAEQSIQAVRPGMPVMGVSAKTGEGMDRYIGLFDHR